MKALIVVDMQNDFMSWGSLPTPHAETLIPTINQLMEKFPLVLATKDWHPKAHVSFAENHKGKKVGDTIQLGPIEQILWPVHCVQDTEGAAFAPGLNTENFEKIFYKGTNLEVDSYSTFFDNAHLKETGLSTYLKKRKVKDLYFAGVATEYCVLFSVLDALELGFKATMIRDACRPINLSPDDEKKAIEKMLQKGANVIIASEVC